MRRRRRGNIWTLYNEKAKEQDTSVASRIIEALIKHYQDSVAINAIEEGFTSTSVISSIFHLTDVMARLMQVVRLVDQPDLREKVNLLLEHTHDTERQARSRHLVKQMAPLESTKIDCSGKKEESRKSELDLEDVLLESRPTGREQSEGPSLSD